MGMAAPAAAGLLVAAAVLVLRHGAIWPEWVGRLAADGILGFRVPVIALAGWVLVASLVLAVSGPRWPAPGAPAG